MSTVLIMAGVSGKLKRKYPRRKLSGKESRSTQFEAIPRADQGGCNSRGISYLKEKSKSIFVGKSKPKSEWSYLKDNSKVSG